MVGSDGSIMGPRAAIWVPPMQTGVELCQDGRTRWELPPYLPQPAAVNVGEGGGRSRITRTPRSIYNTKDMILNTRVEQSDL